MRTSIFAGQALLKYSIVSEYLERRPLTAHGIACTLAAALYPWRVFECILECIPIAAQWPASLWRVFECIFECILNRGAMARII
jgi:hypothetical protein